MTGIPTRFHGNEVRGGHSLLAVVCNHRISGCVFVGPPPPPPPLLTLTTQFRAAERDPRGPKGPVCLDPRGQGCLQSVGGRISVSVSVCMCVMLRMTIYKLRHTHFKI